MLTLIQSRAYHMIATTYERTGQSPTLAELSDELHLGGVSAAHACVRRLVERGYVRKGDDFHRGLVPLVPLRTKYFRFDDEAKAFVEVAVTPQRESA